jgi:hypothetical protein
MKRFTIFSILTIILSTLLTSCINNDPKANVNDLQIVSGIRDRKLILEGSKGAQSVFSFRAKHDWSIIDYKGFTCDPSSGHASVNDEAITVTATALRANNSADTILLSELNFKLLSTRFVGISAYQLPQICLPKGKTAFVDALNGSKGSIVFVSSSDDVELVVEGDISATIGEKNDRGEQTIIITANKENTSTTNLPIGTIGFEVDGARQKTKIDVVQTSAIVLDRSEVLLPGKAGGENIFVVDSDFEITVASLSDNFSVTNNGNNTFTVTAKSDNATGEVLTLGAIEVSLVESPDCRCTIDVKQRKAKAPQTIIIHFVGTALQHYYNHNVTKIIEALNSNIQGDAQVVAITTDATTKATLYELRYDATRGNAVQEKVKALELPTPYNSELFEGIIREALNFAPAEKYALVIGSH